MGWLELVVTKKQWQWKCPPNHCNAAIRPQVTCHDYLQNLDKSLVQTWCTNHFVLEVVVGDIKGAYALLSNHNWKLWFELSFQVWIGNKLLFLQNHCLPSLDSLENCDLLTLEKRQGREQSLHEKERIHKLEAHDFTVTSELGLLTFVLKSILSVFL